MAVDVDNPHIDVIQEPYFPPFFFSRIPFHLMNQQQKGKSAVFTATHANKTPKFKPILECVSKMMVRLASTILWSGHAY